MKFEEAVKAKESGAREVRCGSFTLHIHNKSVHVLSNGKEHKLTPIHIIEAKWEVVEEEAIPGANIEPSKDMHFYCRKCDQAPIDVEKDKDGFYICKECKDFASVVDKDEQEKEDISFEQELREAYDNNCFGDILDVIQTRNDEFIDWCIHSPHHVKLPSIAVFKDKAKKIYGEHLTRN